MQVRFYILSLGLVLLTATAKSQSPAFPQITFPVIQNGVQLPYPFAGGLNAPQFNAADLNGDGANDLVIFDRSSSSVLTFLNNLTGGASAYYYAPEYARTFPELVDYVSLRDYNNDGAMDIFTAPIEPGNLEMRVFRGFFQDGVLRFTPFTFHYPNCNSCDPTYIYYPDLQPGLWNNFPIAPSDYPSVDDIDGDGDMDIVAFSSGNSVYLSYLKNMSVERGFGTDSLQFVFADRCWGKFFENGIERCKALLSGLPNECAVPFTGGGMADDRNIHPGASVLIFDHDSDGDKDLLLGNISFNCLNLLINTNGSTNAWMTEQDTLFPKESESVDLLSFPAAFHLDIDNDGVKDLLVSPNSPTLHEDRNNVWWYKNTNPGGPANFQLQSKKLFTTGMIDVGTSSHPAFVDVNADGLMDIVMGNYGYFTPAQNGQPAIFTNASLYYFQNIGTPSLPKFSLVDTDWLGLSSYAPNDFDFNPAFGDMDNDGDLDLLVGSNIGALYYFKNGAGAGNPMSFVQDFDDMWINMDVGQVSAPVIFDLDQDGLPDIICGERNGNINFYKNTGTPTDPLFNPDENAAPNIANLGAINTQIVPNGIGYSTPQVVVVNGSTLLITGAQDGQLEAYQLTGPTSSAFPEVNLNFGNINAGNRSCPSFADINDDGILEVVVGNQRGGLSMYRTQLQAFTPPVGTDGPMAELIFEVMPNPASDFVQLHIDAQWLGQTKTWALYDALGRLMLEGQSQSNYVTLPTQNLSQGMYWIRVESKNAVGAKKLMVRY